jgi:hypothetical protein
MNISAQDFRLLKPFNASDLIVPTIFGDVVAYQT